MPDYIDPASFGEFIVSLKSTEVHHDAALRGARIWESMRTALAADAYQRVQELDDASKELLAKRCERIADRLVKHLRDYSAVPDASDAALQYAAFERSHRALVVALVAGEFGMAITRSIEVAPSGRARVDAALFEVEMVLGEGGSYSPRWAAPYTPQEVRRGRVAWVLAYARVRGDEGLAPEEAAELRRAGDKAAAEQPLSDADMRAVEYAFERLQPGWALLSTEPGRRELEVAERSRARDACARLLADFPDRWSATEREFLEQLPARPDADLLPAIAAEVHRLHARELARDAQALARARIEEIRPHARRRLEGLTEAEAASYARLLQVSAERDLTPYELSDAESLHDRVLTIIEGGS